MPVVGWGWTGCCGVFNGGQVGEQVIEHVTPVAFAFGELEAVLLAFVGVVINLKHDAIEFAVLELPQVFANAVLGSLLGQITEP
jgi:hypothetical protein